MERSVSTRALGLCGFTCGQRGEHPGGHPLHTGLDELGREGLLCDDGNVGSARTIEANGGVLEDVRGTESGVKRRYWITLDAAGTAIP